MTRPTPPSRGYGSSLLCPVRAIVVGAGERAEQLVREAHLAVKHTVHVVAIVDLDGVRQGRTISGVQVLGTIDDLPAFTQRLQADLAIIALQPENSSQMRRVVDRCIAAGIRFQTLPSMAESLAEGLALDQVRNVRIEDLIGRPPIKLASSPVSADLRNRVILLTGAAGSIGSELARQIAPFAPARLILLDRAESDLYFLHLELSEAHPGLDIVPVICDIASQTRVAQVYAEHRPEYVIHAAAYKHVPLMETNVVEAVRNNVLGTLLIATNAVRYGATKLLLVSTDKAINPSSVMGATKRVAERIVFGLPNLHRTGTDFRAVRFGNVLASQGSVIPLFERQLAAGRPLTVTDELVQRYFMTIPEASQLVLQAGALDECAGAIAMLEMGEPVRILELAEKLIHFSGKVPGRDVRIVFTGLRPGEKLIEEQTSSLEATVPTSVERIRISQARETAGSELEQKLSRLFDFLQSGDQEGLLVTLCELVPECVPPLQRVRSTPDASIGARKGGTWPLSDLAEPRPDRRRATPRIIEPPELRLAERRKGIDCRRKTPRVGGRRQTDVVAEAPMVSSPGH